MMLDGQDKTVILSEVDGFLSRFKKKLMPSANIADDDDQPAVHGDKLEGENSRDQVIDRIFNVPSDSVRAVLFLNGADLRDRYLQSGQGAANTVKMLSAADISAIFGFDGSDVKSAVFKIVAGDFSLNDIVGAVSVKRPFAVLFNIRSGLAQQLKSANNESVGKELLQKAISHNNYIAVLNTVKIKEAGVGPLKNSAERSKKFSMNFISAYPKRNVIDAAREIQQELDTFQAASSGSSDEDSTAPQQSTAQPAQNATKLADAIATKIAFAGTVLAQKAAANGQIPTDQAARIALRDKIIDAMRLHPALKGRENLILQVLNKFHSLLRNSKDYAEIKSLMAGAEASVQDDDTDAEDIVADLEKSGKLDQVMKILAKRNAP